MSCNAYLNMTTAATIAFATGGYLVLSGSLSQSNAGENGSAAQQTDAALPVSFRHTSEDGDVPKNSVDANYEIKTAQKADDPELEDKKPKAAEETKKSGRTVIKKTSANKKSADAGRTKVDGEQDFFMPDPQYDGKYEAAEQGEIYGGKRVVEPPRPPIEIGRQQYTSGIYDESSTFLGPKNPLLPGFAVYGDWRTAVAYNNNNGKDVAQIATRLNLDVDLKLTGTERIHAFFTPLQRDNVKFTRFEFGGSDRDNRFSDEFDPEPQTLFFEGDFGSLYTGFSGQEASFDLPFTVGLFPLFLQNGIWANDAILGGAFSLPAKNSAALGLANFDITFFAAFDNVNNAGLIGKDNDNANLFGVTAFIDAFNGYIETGYGLVQGHGELEGLQTHFLTAAYTRRYYNTVSNSTRFFANVGDDPSGLSDGLAIISENSLITGLPSTLLPYANFFIGFGNPLPLVDGFNAGILKNVGINFETDALTGYPKLDDTGSDAVGGAIGLQYLFNLDQQLVFEVATVQPFSKDGIGAQEAQYAFGVRYQIPLDRAWLFRADATYQVVEDAQEDNFGLRFEFRRKF